MAEDERKKDNDTSKLKRKEYEKELRELQAELCHLQAWVKHKGLRIMVLFEGRDGAGIDDRQVGAGPRHLADPNRRGYLGARRHCGGSILRTRPPPRHAALLASEAPCPIRS